MEHWSGPFRIWRSYPGRFLPKTRDTGLGALGCVDHASLMPGLRVPMHTHQDDEIFSYLREGALTHTDSLGRRLILDARHPLMMNAGSGLAHEEHIPDGSPPVRMLQIFVRPTVAGLPPTLQYGELDTAESRNQWRLLAGPEGSEAPFHFRNAVTFHDLYLEHATLPPPPAMVHEIRWLYVFSGHVTMGEDTLATGDAVLLDAAGEVSLVAKEAAQLVCFHCDQTAPSTRNGSLSG